MLCDFIIKLVDALLQLPPLHCIMVHPSDGFRDTAFVVQLVPDHVVVPGYQQSCISSHCHILVPFGWHQAASIPTFLSFGSEGRGRSSSLRSTSLENFCMGFLA